jgi:hypothetical protein
MEEIQNKIYDIKEKIQTMFRKVSIQMVTVLLAIMMLASSVAADEVGITPTVLPTIANSQNPYPLEINDNGQILGRAQIGNINKYYLSNQDQIIELGLFPGASYTNAIHLNNNDQVIGTAGIGSANIGWIWEDGVFTNLGKLNVNDTQTIPQYMNDNGMVAGISRDSSYNTTAWIWQNGQFTILPTAAGYNNIQLRKLNNNDQVIGFAYIQNSNTYKPWIWEDGQYTELVGLPNSTSSYPQYLNDQGDVIGSSNFSNINKFWKWHDGQLTEITGLTGKSNTQIHGLNENGQILGTSSDSNNNRQSWIMKDGQYTEIAKYQGLTNSNVNTLNDLGQVIGLSYDSNYVTTGWVWTNGEFTKLEKLAGSNYTNARYAYDMYINGLNKVMNNSKVLGQAQNAAIVWELAPQAPIDTLAPTATVAYSTTSLTNQDVIATITPSEEVMITNNNGLKTYTFTENGSVTITFVDLAGNVGTATATVSNIDKVAPTATVAYSKTSLTNQDVTATITPSEQVTITNNNGLNTNTFSENGTVIFTFADLAGNVGTATATVNNIDKVAPTATVAYSTTSLTNQDVTATITPSEQVTITNNNGLNTNTFSVNGSVTFTFVDLAGNTGIATATVSNIDKVAPTATVVYSTTNLTNQDVTATITLSEAATITNNNGLNTYTFSDNGSVTFTFVDLAGNTGTATATVSNIDKAAPTATVNLSANVIEKSNHKMVTITANVVNADDQSSVNTVVLTSITSNEADNGLGDGDTENDIQNASYGTADFNFDLRGERSGKGTGRVYTITYTITDQAGNVTIASATVTVPKGSGK